MGGALVTIRWKSGLLEDVPLSIAQHLVSTAQASEVTPLPPVVETAMMAGPAPREYAPSKKPKKPRKPRR